MILATRFWGILAPEGTVGWIQANLNGEEKMAAVEGVIANVAATDLALAESIIADLPKGKRQDVVKTLFPYVFEQDPVVAMRVVWDYGDGVKLGSVNLEFILETISDENLSAFIDCYIRGAIEGKPSNFALINSALIRQVRTSPARAMETAMKLASSMKYMTMGYLMAERILCAPEQASEIVKTAFSDSRLKKVSGNEKTVKSPTKKLRVRLIKRWPARNTTKNC